MKEREDIGGVAEEEAACDRLEAMYRFEEGEGDPHEEPRDDLATRRYVDEILDRSEGYRPIDQADGDRPRRFVPTILVAVLAASAAAAVLLIWSPGGEDVVPQEELVAKHLSPSSDLVVGLMGGSARAGVVPEMKIGDEIDMATSLEAGETGALISVAGKIALLVDRDSTVRLRSVSPGLEVSLESGALLANVDPDSDPPRLLVSTADGSVEVTGTVFSVESDGRTASVEVFRGTVTLGNDTGRRGLSAGVASTMDGSVEGSIEGDRSRLMLDEADRILDLAREADEERYAAIELDRVFGREAGDRVPSADDPVAELDVDVKPVASGPSASQLLDTAREAKKAGDWKSAASSYRMLLSRYPASSEAGLAMVALGSIQLNRLGQPRKALRSFEGYLSGNKGGTLEVEARWGRAKALRAIGSTGEERRALEEFLERHPGAFQVPAARERLAQLR